MPIHDWSHVEAGIFHDFHHEWISAIKQALNNGILPPDHYALAEQITGGLGPDVLTLQGPTIGTYSPPEPGGPVTAVATQPPKVRFHQKTEKDIYAGKAKTVAIRHRSDHRVVAVVEIVSPGNKSSRYGLRQFVDKAVELLRSGVQLLVIDLFKPTPRDPQGIHKVIWDEFQDTDFSLPGDLPLTLAAYSTNGWPEAYVEPVAIGQPLPEMPIFLSMRAYVSLPLEPTYMAAWNAVPAYWRGVVAGE